MRVTAIFRHPVKGLPGEELDHVHLETGQAMPNDRTWALAHAKSEVDRAKPVWVPRRNFLVVAFSPALASLRIQYDDGLEHLSVISAGERRGYDLKSDQGQSELAGYLEQLAGPTQPSPLQLLRVATGSMTDSPTETVSIMNDASRRDLERRTDQVLDRRRFRGNIWIDREPAWCEFDWLGQGIELGTSGLAIQERIERCAAINADPASGQTGANLPLMMRQQLGHLDFGVLAEVTRSGDVSVAE